MGESTAIALALEHKIPFFSELKYIETCFRHFPCRCPVVDQPDYKGPLFPSRGPYHVRKIWVHQQKSVARVLFYGDHPTYQGGLVENGFPLQAYIGKQRQSDAQALTNMEARHFGDGVQWHSHGALIHVFLGNVLFQPWWDNQMKREDAAFNSLFSMHALGMFEFVATENWRTVGMKGENRTVRTFSFCEPAPVLLRWFHRLVA